ncbi:DUF378 domain-containing protein [Halorussus halophilus]|uniref:DUF378 domain-containing protein n=1 Tax=Halorussus halophilus TaxID=2650975 RepID=UPI001300F118|nr:DUF378 domain-containing protein [Halorussus halophilus]
MKTNAFDWLALLLVIFGAVTWGIIGVTGFTGDEVNVLVLALDPVFRPAAAEVVRNLVYVLVGVAGVYLLYTSYKMGRASRRAARTSRTPTRVESTDTSNRPNDTSGRSETPENTDS